MARPNIARAPVFVKHRNGRQVVRPKAPIKPIGMGAGLALTVVIHFIWNRLPGRTTTSGTLLQPRSSSVEGPQGPDTYRE